MIAPLPWHVIEPYRGCDGERMNYSIWDADANLVVEACDANEDEARAACVAIVNAVNRTGPAECAHCGMPAACFGSYEDELHPAFACNECCGHGCEDGSCTLLEALTKEVRPCPNPAVPVRTDDEPPGSTAPGGSCPDGAVRS